MTASLAWMGYVLQGKGVSCTERVCLHDRVSSTNKTRSTSLRTTSPRVRPPASTRCVSKKCVLYKVGVSRKDVTAFLAQMGGVYRQKGVSDTDATVSSSQISGGLMGPAGGNRRGARLCGQLCFLPPRQGVCLLPFLYRLPSRALPSETKVKGGTSRS